VPDVSFDNLFLVVLVGAAAPLALGFAPRLRLPSVVVELVAGIVLGPAVLGWLEVDLPVQVLSLIGLAFLLFLSGLEIDVRQLRGALLRGAVLGYLLTLALGVPIGLTLDAAGWVSTPVLVIIALSATSLGLVVPVLKDAGQSDNRVGQSAILAATVADFAGRPTAARAVGCRCSACSSCSSPSPGSWCPAPAAPCASARCWSGCRTRPRRSGCGSPLYY
jgi:Kef-type K+ transport system membrane component KefB